MVDKIPISAAKAVADKYDQKQVIMLCWDGATTHVVTYGKTIKDCEQAAEGGNKLKKALGWPDKLCHDKPTRIKSEPTTLCRQKLQALGKSYPKSSCQKCGSLLRVGWRCAEEVGAAACPSPKDAPQAC